MRRAMLLAAGAVAVVVAIGAALFAFRGGDDEADLADDRAEQLRSAAADAGLDAEVADVLALAARGATATFQVSYPGTDGTSLVVSQEPPNRRVDVLQAGLLVQSQVVRDGVSYRCQLPSRGRPGDELECTRTGGAIESPGAFTEEALTTFTEELAASLDALDLTVEARTIADTPASCLVTAPKAGTRLDPEGPGVDTICLSHEGAQLLVDRGGERVVADDYSTTVPDGTFDV
ncbi:MAG: hypothetical protein ACRDYW_07470 [Acidimicrobiales bacterium]